MLRLTLLAVIILIAPSVLAGDLFSAQAQRRSVSAGRSRQVNKEPASTNSEATKPAANDAANEEAIKKINEKIDDDCKALSRTIKIADLSRPDPPYYMHQFDSGYKCQDGQFKWTATRHDYGSLIQDKKVITVTLDATTLGRVFVQGSIVWLRSDGTIEVAIDGQENPQLEWFLELRKTENAKSFAATLQDLIANLETRQKLLAAKPEKKTEAPAGGSRN